MSGGVVGRWLRSAAARPRAGVVDAYARTVVAFKRSRQLAAHDLSVSSVANGARRDAGGRCELFRRRLALGAVKMIQDCDALEMPARSLR